jgi:hypothetical protein
MTITSFNNHIKAAGQWLISDGIKWEDYACPICLEIPKEPKALFCGAGHLFCEPCIDRAINLDPRCPLCRNNSIGLSQISGNLYRAVSGATREDADFPSQVQVIKRALDRLNQFPDAELTKLKQLSEGTPVERIAAIFRRAEVSLLISGGAPIVLGVVLGHGSAVTASIAGLTSGIFFLLTQRNKKRTAFAIFTGSLASVSGVIYKSEEERHKQLARYFENIIVEEAKSESDLPFERMRMNMEKALTEKSRIYRQLPILEKFSTSGFDALKFSLNSADEKVMKSYTPFLKDLAENDAGIVARAAFPALAMVFAVYAASLPGSSPIRKMLIIAATVAMISASYW